MYVAVHFACYVRMENDLYSKNYFTGIFKKQNWKHSVVYETVFSKFYDIRINKTNNIYLISWFSVEKVVP